MTTRDTDQVTIVVFAKAPQPGQVKTRLIPALGAQGAAALHAELVRLTLATAQQAGAGSVELCCAPHAGHPFFAGCAAEFDVTLTEQAGNDLGERMANAFQRVLPRAQALLIGTDCPVLQPTHLWQARDALRAGTDAVFAPTEDGGYVLIGLRRFAPNLFADMAWSTASVMAETRTRLRRLKWNWQELDTLWDVDRPEDLRRLLRLRLPGFARGELQTQ